MTVEIVPARYRHVATIANRMRAADVREARAMSHSPREALRLGLAGSVLAWTALVDGRPEAMLGVAPVSVLESVGRPWMLGTDVVPRHARAIVEHGPALVAAMRSRFLRLENAVDGGNRQACRLLLWLGFRIEPAAEVVGGVPFRAFSWEG